MIETGIIIGTERRLDKRGSWFCWIRTRGDPDWGFGVGGGGDSP